MVETTSHSLKKSVQSVLLLRLECAGHRHRDGLVRLRRCLRRRKLATGGLRCGFRGPLGVFVEIIGGIGRRLTVPNGLTFGVHIVRILGFDIGKRVEGTRTGLLRTELLGKLIVIGVGGQVLELSGYFLKKRTRMTDETQEQQITAVGNEMSASFLAAKKRSNATLAKLEEHPEKFTMLTGDRPTGRLHLGHYFGSIRERVAMQNRGVNSNIIIADYQVITDRDTTEHIEDNVLNLVLDYMAAGIDPNKTMIFTHSAVPAENQLMLPFLSLVTEAELHRNPTVKSEMEASGHALTGLLLTYPVHQACDILFCKANVVPIGKDNLPHVEITRTIARRFNERYAKKNPVFPEPSAILSEAPEIPGLDGRKMSKSYGNSIMLGATAEETAKLIKKSPTDSERRITFDPIARPQVSALLTTAGLVTGRDPKDIAEEIGDSGAGALKKYVIESVNEFLAPHRERRAELAKDMDSIRDILHDGNKRANEIANETLQQVRDAMGMRY